MQHGLQHLFTTTAGRGLPEPARWRPSLESNLPPVLASGQLVASAPAAGAMPRAMPGIGCQPHIQCLRVCGRPLRAVTLRQPIRSAGLDVSLRGAEHRRSSRCGQKAGECQLPQTVHRRAGATLGLCFSTVFSLIPRRFATSFCGSLYPAQPNYFAATVGQLIRQSPIDANDWRPPHQRSGDTSSIRTCEGSKSPIGSIETTLLRRRRSVIRWRALVNKNALGWVGSPFAAASYTRAYSSWRKSGTSSGCDQCRCR